ncbi:MULTISPECIES: ScbR family autoregulator-binding transcription factor [unclassified Pseudoclavibacter]|uniref:ScbR family autoregulator-binding transcription factor n=1 Tax=unclassified Pseudoclavibacter TaxID=2615177 RepID=UPI0015E31A86|nr:MULTISPECIES: ScbR family autoregulator-binding transcription factor [unclassified Pseudoclavibacter]MBF4549514.1 TetR/AcrR family transcriptional regulator [Pseudoclavibacter sp. VKM Ac-2888]
MKRAEQRAQTRQALLEAASLEFEANGYAATVLSDISDRLGMTKGTVYFHFPTKALLAKAVSATWTEMWDAEIARSRDRGLSLDELESLMIRIAERFQSDSLMRATIRLVRERELIEEELPRPFDAWLEVTKEALQASRESGVLRDDIDVDAAAWQVLANLVGIQMLMQDLNDGRSIVERVREMWAVHRVTLANPGRTADVASS